MTPAEKMALYRASLVARGLCLKCGKVPPEPGRPKCAACMEETKLYQRWRREGRNRKGQCADCGKAPSAPGKKRCEACIEAAAKCKARRTARGQCAACESYDPLPGLTLCAPCLAKRNRYGKDLRTSRREAGKCPKCARAVTPKEIYCVNCRDFINRSSKAIRAERVLRKLCPGCGDPPVPNRRLCQDCFVKHAARRYFGTSRNWRSLRALFDAQGGRCPYSGVALTIGVDAEIDHKIARSTGGPDKIENLQWVHTYVNIMKWDLPEDEFLAFVAKIYRHRIEG